MLRKMSCVDPLVEKGFQVFSGVLFTGSYEVGYFCGLSGVVSQKGLQHLFEVLIAQLFSQGVNAPGHKIIGVSGVHLLSFGIARNIAGNATSRSFIASLHMLVEIDSEVVSGVRCAKIGRERLLHPDISPAAYAHRVAEPLVSGLVRYNFGGKVNHRTVQVDSLGFHGSLGINVSGLGFESSAEELF